MRAPAFILCACLAIACAFGQAPGRALAAGQNNASAQLIPLEQVFAMLRKSYSGDKLDARIRRGANTTYYEVHWLTAEGHKLVFLVNAFTGAIEQTRGADAGGGR